MNPRMSHCNGRCMNVSTNNLTTPETICCRSLCIIPARIHGQVWILNCNTPIHTPARALRQHNDTHTRHGRTQFVYVIELPQLFNICLHRPNTEYVRFGPMKLILTSTQFLTTQNFTRSCAVSDNTKIHQIFVFFPHLSTPPMSATRWHGTACPCS